MTAKKISRKFVQRYTGALATPIRTPERRAQGLVNAPQDGLPHGTYFSKGEPERVRSEMIDKMLLLYDRFGIDPASKDAWMRLAFELAVRHVPGFSIEVQPRHGRPVEKGVNENIQLFLSVRQIQDEEKMAGRSASVAAACKILATREASGTAREGNTTHIKSRSKSLQNRYIEAKELLQGTSKAIIPEEPSSQK